MKLRAIAINGLFGTFDHHIPLFQREPITIIHGPNGVGKTSILRLVYGTLSGASSHLRNIPFRELALTFEDETTLVVHPMQDGPPSDRTPRPVTLLFRLLRDGLSTEEYIQPANPSVRQRLDHYLPFITQVGPDEWMDGHSETMLTWEEVVQAYGDRLPESVKLAETPPWLRRIQEATPVHFIETQRLLNTKPRIRSKHRPTESMVSRCSSELADHINSTLARSATISQGLERSFPSRLIQESSDILSEEETRAKLAQLDQRRARLVEAGLLDAGYEPAMPTKRLDDTTRRVLTVYIRDTEQKLTVFDELLSKIELIKSIIDARFLQKSISIDRQVGFHVKTRDGRRVSLSGLSSGEQHELVLLYELLFRSKANTLILIDEPELSLHIAWQQKFLRDLLDITRLARIQALVATHSPQIIHDRWDLTVELTGTSR